MNRVIWPFPPFSFLLCKLWTWCMGLQKPPCDRWLGKDWERCSHVCWALSFEALNQFWNSSEIETWKNNGFHFRGLWFRCCVTQTQAQSLRDTSPVRVHLQLTCKLISLSYKIQSFEWLVQHEHVVGAGEIWPMWYEEEFALPPVNNITDSKDISRANSVKDREAWYAEVHAVTKSQTRLSNWTT